MSFLAPHVGTPQAPPPPPPPPAPAQAASSAVQDSGAATRAAAAAASGMGFDGTAVSGASGAATPMTAKPLLGS